jgi:CheY-like chemotaxis protein
MADPALQLMIVHKETGERELVSAVLRGFRVRVEAVGNGQQAAQLVKKRKFDGFFIDGELPQGGGLELVRQIRKSASNKNAPIVFITDARSTIRLGDAFQAGVTFFLSRPLDQKKVTRLLNATRGSMLAERRSYHRVAVATPVRWQAGKKSGQVQSVNISRSGILIEAGDALAVGDVAELRFTLPGQATPIQAQAEVVRVDEQGRAGMRFTRLDASGLEQLQSFIGL